MIDCQRLIPFSTNTNEIPSNVVNLLLLSIRIDNIAKD